jgi:hypothetical protein
VLAAHQYGPGPVLAAERQQAMHTPPRSGPDKASAVAEPRNDDHAGCRSARFLIPSSIRPSITMLSEPQITPTVTAICKPGGHRTADGQRAALPDRLTPWATPWLTAPC